jgi:transcriptional regulator with XRE-family HTH domain
MDIYDRIDQAIERKNISRRQLALKAGFPPSSLQSTFDKKSKSFDFKLLRKIKEILNVDYEYLLEDEITDQCLNHVIAVLEDCGFVVERDEKDIEYDEWRITGQNLAVVYTTPVLLGLIEEIEVDANRNRTEYIKRRLNDIMRN